MAPKQIATTIVQRLQAAGHQAFWVGGCVRDFLLGREPQDFDIATDAKPDQVEKLFKRTIAVGKKFGVIVVVEDGQQFQVATFRAEADYQDGRRPEKVVFADAKADAVRRDFTVNGLFYDPITEETHDWVGGEKDLKARVIRTIGDPAERFGEDHLRLLRAVRFAVQLDFEIEPKTFAAVKAMASKIKLISAERVRDELVKLFAVPERVGAGNPQRVTAPVPEAGAQRSARPTCAGPARGLVLLRESGLLNYVLPELEATITCDQSPDHHPEGTVFEHVRLMLEKMAQPSPQGGSGAARVDESLPWAVLLHDIAKPVTAEKDAKTGSIHFYGHEKIGADMAGRMLERLRFPRKQIDEVVAAVRYHMQFKDVKQMRKATLRRMLLRETFPLELELHRLDCLGSHGSLEFYDFLKEQVAELEKKPEIRPPLLTGKDLIDLGMKPGPRMGELLNELRDKQLAEEIKTAPAAKAWARQEVRRRKAEGRS
ncbi:MAG TPA: CCA tRNA nucleotidyltransferase [Desulfuromonadaceae bacterium]|nr:CCA tRNA nucleotidyltransferase [Desulfuromonadaceae bacterium]